MSELKIIIQDKLSISRVTTNIVLPLFVSCDGKFFPCNQWTDFAEIMNTWACTLLKNLSKSEGRFVLYFMDGPYRIDVTKSKEMKLTLQCVNFRNDDVVELAILCDYIDLLEALYIAVKTFSRILYDNSLHQGRFEPVYKQSLITCKELESAIKKCK